MNRKAFFKKLAGGAAVAVVLPYLPRAKPAKSVKQLADEFYFNVRRDIEMSIFQTGTPYSVGDIVDVKGIGDWDGKYRVTSVRDAIVGTELGHETRVRSI